MKLLFFIFIFMSLIAWTPISNRMCFVGHSNTQQWVDYAITNPPKLPDGTRAEIVYSRISGIMWGLRIVDWMTEGDCSEAIPVDFAGANTDPYPSWDCLVTAAPEYVVVTIEFNDVWTHYAPKYHNGNIDNIIIEYKKLIRKIKNVCPSCKIVLLTCPPSAETGLTGRGAVSSFRQSGNLESYNCLPGELDVSHCYLTCTEDNAMYFCNPYFNQNHAHVVSQIRDFAKEDNLYFADSFNAVLNHYGKTGLDDFKSDYLTPYDNLHFKILGFDAEESAPQFYNTFVKPEIEKWFKFSDAKLNGCTRK